MIFTLCYVYATIMQWWRLRHLRNKLNGTLNEQNALLVCFANHVTTRHQHRSLENLLLCHQDRIACTIVPKQKVNLCQWIAFPKNRRYFPIFLGDDGGGGLKCCQDGRFVLLQAVLDKYVRHEGGVVAIEEFGELLGWKVSGDAFEVVVKMDLDSLTKLAQSFIQNDIDINHELKLLKIETVDVEGVPTSIKYDKKYMKEQTLKYSYAPVHWNSFVMEIRELYAKIRDITNPKIKIENGTTKCFESIPKPTKSVKKSTENTLEVTKKDSVKKSVNDEVKNTLDVSTGGEHRRHKHGDHKGQGKSDKKVSTSKGKNKMRNEEKLEVKIPKKEHKKSNVKLTKQASVKDDEVVSVKVDNESHNKTKEDKNRPVVKPPNVLVYSDSVITKDNVKRVLYSILNKEKYTIYDLPLHSHSWDKSTVLVVVCGSVPPDLTAHLIQYLLNGGQLLCLCSDLMYSVLHTFTTAEVREHELVRFSYGTWQRVKMMHHIFCYQASPAKKQFSKDSDHSNHSSSNGSSPLAPRTPSVVELRHNDREYQVLVQVLGAEETWQTPSLLLAKVRNSEGRAVFSQVHLEIDPEEFENDEEKYRSLLSSNEARLEILKDILMNHLELACDANFGNVEYTAGYFLGRFDAKVSMVSDCDNIINNQLTCEKINVVFCGHKTEPGIATNIRLPILIHSCPPNFSTLDYFETLNTEDLGRLVIYTDILTSSQNLLTKKLRHGLAVIVRQQTNGIGRASNTWISPIGSASFSLQLHIPMDSPMGQSLPLIQHLAMVAVVSAIRNLPGYDVLDFAIKWPNDLYVDKSVKIGGLIVSSTIISGLAIVNIGVGVNLSNQNPTISINDVIERINKESGVGLKPITYEKYFALVFNEFERLYKNVQISGIDTLLDLYYKYWLHSNVDITIQSEVGESKKAKIVGIDEYGYLKVQLTDGSVMTVQPDGNSFDMMRGLIIPKYL